MPLGRVRRGTQHSTQRGDRLSEARPPSPYPGLAAYGDDDDDAELFFGRDRQRDLIIANLRAARLTVLHGHSGAGKTSLLRAGVVHRLRHRAAGDDLDDDEPRTAVVLFDDWSGDPVARLAAQLQALTDDRPRGAKARPAGDGSRPVLDAVTAYCARGRGGVLLIFDQFEECLRLQPDCAPGLDEVIAMLVRDQRASVRILIAVRDDRVGDLDRFGARIPGLFDNVLRLGPLSPAGALEAIQRPIERWAAWAREGRGDQPVTLEPGLGEAIRDELVALSARHLSSPLTTGRAGDRGVEPPFLQLVMRRLWDEDVTIRGGTTIRHATLARLGGADAIVASHLDTALARLSSAERALAEEMLRFLVTPSGATTSLTARDLSEYTGKPEPRIEALAEKLSRPPARVLRGAAAAGGRGAYELPELLAEPTLEWRARRRTARLEARARRLLLALVAVSAVAVALVAYAVRPGVVQQLELSSVDARFDVRGSRPADPRVALVSVDDAAFERLRAGPRIPRATWARALRAIASADPRVLAVDVIFTGRRRPADDRELIATVNGPVRDRLVLATDQLDTLGKSQLFGRDRQVFGDRDAPAVGYAGFPRDPDGAVRKIERSVSLTGGEPLGALAVVTRRRAGTRQEDLPPTAWIDYRGPEGTFPRISLDDVLRRRRAALSRLRSKIVILGITGRATTDDRHRTSAPGTSDMVGPEMQANAVSTALDDFPLRDGGRAIDIALIVALGLLPAGLALVLRARLVVAATVIAAALFCAGAQLAFGAGRVISVVSPLVALVLATSGVLGALLLHGRRNPPRSSHSQ
ncbi:MAG TPA: CHASE2 domain-containing protein [Solirubrobacteraceae bacterium]|nr:CHASE2 domain-containing protein [Solirubrobacteraceae bacterium]